MGIPLYYYLIGRKLFGPAMKYPLMRLAHFPERILRRKRYLDFSSSHRPRLVAPEFVPVPEERKRLEVPELTVLQ